MWSWFSPQCPLDTWEKTWTETRMRWLADRLGLDRLRHAEVVLPSDDYFGEPYCGSMADVRRMMNRLCNYMGIDPARVALEVSRDGQLPGAAGRYDRAGRPDRAVIRVATSQLKDPLALVATLAHELAHEILIGGKLIDETVFDHEWVTDLLPVYLGVGVFAANAVIREEYSASGSWWRMQRQGYLPARIFGYALALFAFMRGEQDPAWVRHLRPDAASALGKGLRYLRKANDCLFHPHTIGGTRRPLTVAEAVEQLRTGSATIRLAALWDVQEQGVTGQEFVVAVTAHLTDDDPAVAAEAARVLGGFGALAAPAVPKLCRALRSSSDNVRAEAARALGTLRAEPEMVVSELSALLGDESELVSHAVAWAIAQFGRPIDEISLRRLLAGFRAALKECNYAMIEVVAQALRVAAVNPEQSVAEYFDNQGQEFKRQALAALREHRSADGKVGH